MSKINRYKVDLKLVHNKCRHKWFSQGGYEFQFGVVYVRKDKVKNKNVLTLTKFERLFTEMEEFVGDSCSINDIMKQNELLKDFESYCVSFRHANLTMGGDKQYYDCNIVRNSKHGDTYRLYNSFRDSFNEYYHDINKLSMIIENNKLCFEMKNDIIGQNYQFNDNAIENGKFNLDFGKYYYYFALSSVRCSCREAKTSGFEFQVSV